MKNLSSISRKKLEQDSIGFLFLLPLFLIIGVLLVYSVYFIFKNGFFKFDLSFSEFKYVGLENFKNLFSDKIFYRSILNNLFYSVVVILSGITIGFIFAVLLSLNIRGGKVFFAIVFIPSILPRALISTVFREMFEHHSGTINIAIRFLGLNADNLNWLTDPSMAYLSIVSVFVYMIGLPLLYYNSDLANMDQGILEAARIDGASLGQLIVKIIYPLVSSSHKTIIISSLLATFRMFETVFLLTKSGPGFTTEITGTYIYRFTRPGTHLGFVCAAATVILIVALFLAIIQTSVLYKPNKK